MKYTYHGNQSCEERCKQSTFDNSHHGAQTDSTVWVFIQNGKRFYKLDACMKSEGLEMPTAYYSHIDQE